ncbi:hypothetical protein Bhyg_04656 [Pseudolycoriella hygida]|uniref:Uncharacterized protein n=1 Tax=Pseudolycoriella hygida TaxID=35572 RepID=A0A9Q0NFN4_9DIPT|nr:hypothetical protein Bhyg_04656 [Pseudolycoriella hygida]
MYDYKLLNCCVSSMLGRRRQEFLIKNQVEIEIVEDYDSFRNSEKIGFIENCFTISSVFEMDNFLKILVCLSIKLNGCLLVFAQLSSVTAEDVKTAQKRDNCYLRISATHTSAFRECVVFIPHLDGNVAGNDYNTSNNKLKQQIL